MLSQAPNQLMTDGWGKVLWMCGWMVSNGQIGHTYWLVKGPHWEHIFQHQRGCGFPFMERRSCFFFFAWRKLKMLVPVLPIEQVLASLFLDCMWEFDLKVLLG